MHQNACTPHAQAGAADANGPEPLVSTLVEPRMAGMVPCSEFAREARIPLRTAQAWCRSGRLDAFWSPWARQWLVREGEIARIASAKEAGHA